MAGGDSGVAFFLILSGFVMCAGYERRIADNSLEYSRFIKKRIIRLYPLHIFCMLWAAAIIGIGSFAGWPGLISNLFLVQSWIPEESIYFSGNAVGWCLSDLMFFYTLFPFIVRFALKRRKLFRYMATSLCCIYAVGTVFIPQDLWSAVIYISPATRILDFIIGIMLWQIYSILKDNNLNVSRFNINVLETLCVLIVIAAYICYPLIPQNWSLSSYWWIPISMVILIFSLFNNGNGWITWLLTRNPLIKFGDISFSFYMIHVLGMKSVFKAFQLAGVNLDYTVSLPVVLIIDIILAILINRYFERPVEKSLLGKYLC